MDKSQALRKLKENGTSFESFNNGYIMQVGKQIKVYEDGYKGPKVLTQAQQNKLLAERPALPMEGLQGRLAQRQPMKDSRLMYMDDEDNTDEQDDDADDEEETIPKVKPKSFRDENHQDFRERVMLCSTKR
ncbi:MAG: hypothetical protein EZS28_036033 [Streblomastix strix]|uniref:Uncharacterized protein n=1 Tax=Streblomastix strix TaxID=222440 RepID=A0A5J4UCX2_9EUKA|nr:MAG: hypothetical protein EZS28_036033 [Streblomastix strix]